MTTEQLTYVKNQLTAGVTPETIRASLLQNGYSEELITQLFEAAGVTATSEATATTTQTVPQPVPTQANHFIPTIVIWIGAGIITLVFIGFLISSMLVSEVNTARQDANFASARATLGQMRVNAELYFNDSFSYVGLCEASETQSALSSIARYDGFTKERCIAEEDSYLITIATPKSEFLCLDGNGFSGEITTLPTGTSCE